MQISVLTEMKVLLALMMAATSGFALATETAEAADAQSQPALEHYSYSSKLDIARVIDQTPIPAVCAVVPRQMTYEDHQGHRHTVEYLVMGNGCTP